MNAEETLVSWRVEHPKFIHSTSSEILQSSYWGYGNSKPTPITGRRIYLSGLPDFVWLLLKQKSPQFRYTVVEQSTGAVLVRGDTFKGLQDNFFLRMGAYLHGDETVPGLLAELVDDEKKRTAAEQTRREKHGSFMGAD